MEEAIKISLEIAQSVSPTYPNPVLSKHDIEKQKFEDLAKRIEHHSFALRLTPTDFFKTSVIAQASTLFAILGLIINSSLHIPISGDPKSAKASELAKNASEVAKSIFPPTLALPTKLVTVTLAAGVFLSIIGYCVSYFISRARTADLRKMMDDHLYKNYPIEEVRPHLYYYFVPIFLAAGIMQVCVLLFVVAWFVDIAFEIIG